jgi:HPr kinase/phosphorylase
VERLGLEEEKVEILGIPIPHLMIPVAPGRDLARLVEVAALHTKLRLVGHNPAKELNARLLAHMTNSRDV